MYLGMILIMLASMVTVRIVLNALGEVDYGLNNVVAGVITMLSFLTATMTSASLRFFSYEIGTGDHEKLSNYFSVTFWCYLSIAIIIFIIAETFGLWFVKNQLNIPAERVAACMWVYQCSVFAFVINILCIPYYSLLVAHERMNMYAYIGILQAAIKLIVAYLLLVIIGDKLIIYATLTTATSLIPSALLIVYVLKKYPESFVQKYFDKSMLKEVLDYSLWSLFGAISGILRGQGINILLNIFFNPIVNTARAIAYQVNSIISQFVSNFYQTAYPQITKYYAACEHDEMKLLVFRTSRFCYYLTWVFALPILMETSFILELWLKIVPAYTVLFTKLVIILSIVESVSFPLMGIVSATGKIKFYQIVTGTLLILNLPISWLLLKFGYPAQVTMYVAIGISFVAQLVRIIFAKKLARMPIGAYCKDVILNIIIVTAISFIIPYLLHHYLSTSLGSFLAVEFVSVLSVAITVYCIGMSKNERGTIINIVKQKFTLKEI